MSYIQVEGGKRLYGNVTIQGAKNAVLPVLSAALLHKGTTVLTRVPDISDVRNTLELMQFLGCEIKREDHRLVIRAEKLTDRMLPHAMVGRMRSSFLMAGALLGRCGHIQTFYPGGCTIGARPVDLHLNGFRQMGANYVIEREQIALWAENLHGADIVLPYPSVGATENIILAAVLAEGVTYIRGAAKEPEIRAMIQCLNGMGADIQIIDEVVKVVGVKELRDSVYEIPGDRIVAGTLLAAVGSCGGDICLEHVNPVDLQGVLPALEQIGMELMVFQDRIRARCQGRLSGGLQLKTGPFPEFPTDLQAIFVAMLTVAEKESWIREAVFESRFRYVEQLRRFGAQVLVEEDLVKICGRSHLKGSMVEAQDLRAGAALVVAGLAAEGITLISCAEYIQRGYEDLPGDLCKLGASVRLLL